MMELSLENRRAETSILKHPTVGVPMQADGAKGACIQEDLDELESRKSLEKGKGILVPLSSLKIILMSLSSLAIEDCNHFPSPSRMQRQRERGEHHNLVERILDALQDNP